MPKLQSTISLATGFFCSPLIYQGTELPFKKSIDMTTAENGQKEFFIQLMVGENRTVSDNTVLGTYIMDGVPRAPKGTQSAKVHLDIDVDSNLTITATIESTGRTKQLGKVNLLGITPPPVKNPFPSQADIANFNKNMPKWINDFFVDLFEGKMPASMRVERKIKGTDIKLNLSISAKEAQAGIERKIHFPREEACSLCFGQGIKPGSEPMQCTTCGGTGNLREKEQTAVGIVVSAQTCPTCKGRGKIFSSSSSCEKCHGEGKYFRQYPLNVVVPAGTEGGSTIEFSAMGNLGKNDGPRGDVHVKVSIKRFFGLFII